MFINILILYSTAIITLQRHTTLTAKLLLKLTLIIQKKGKNLEESLVSSLYQVYSLLTNNGLHLV